MITRQDIEEQLGWAMVQLDKIFVLTSTGEFSNCTQKDRNLIWQQMHTLTDLIRVLRERLTEFSDEFNS